MTELPPELPPKMPQGWLDQLSATFSQSTRKAVIATILGSSVAAALVTGGLNFLLEGYKALQVAKTEQYKVCLDSHREDLKEKKAEYSTLAEKYRQLAKAFDDCLATCETVLNHQDVQKLRGFAYDSLDDVAQRLIDVKTTAQSPIIDEEVRKNLTELGESLGPAVVAVSDDGRKEPKVSVLPQFLNSCKNEIRPKLDQLGKLIQASMKNLKPEPCDR